MTPARHGALLLAALLFTVSCTDRAQVQADHRLRDDAVRATWSEATRPLTAATQALSALLPRIDVAQAVFTLEAGGWHRRDSRVTAGDLGTPEIAAFFQIERDGLRAWWLWDPRTAELVPVDQTDRFVRLITVGMPGDRRLSLHRYDVAIRGDAVDLTGHAQLAEGPIDDAVLPPRSDIVVMHQRHGDAMHLLAMPVIGGAPVRLADPAELPSPPHALPDGAVLVALGALGRRTPWRIDPATGERQPWHGPLPAGPGAAFLLGADAALNPCIHAVPAAPDPTVLLALVEARDPAINRRRALLAAALAEAGGLRLAPLPTLRFGLDYTVIEGLAVGDVGAVGDVLSEGLIRGVIGLVQPLFDLPRRRAAAEAGAVRATIAADLLMEETLESLAQAAEEWCWIQHLHERLAIDAAAVEAARAAASRTGKRHAAGYGSESDRLLAEQWRIEAEATLAADEALLQRYLGQVRRRCGLAVGTTFAPNPDRLHPITVPGSADDSERQAMLNRPRLIAARRVAEEAFLLGRAGRGGLSGGIGANYGHVRDDSGSAVGDYLNLSLDASLPLSAVAGRQLDANRTQAIIEAQRHAAEQAASEVRSEARRAWDWARSARLSLDGAQAERRWRNEEQRVARLWIERGGPDVNRPIGPDQFDRARAEGLRAARRECDQRRDSALAAVRWWRATGGEPTALPALLRASTRSAHQRMGSTVWIWRMEEILAHPEAALERLTQAGVHRVSCAVGGDGAALAEGPAADAFERFIIAAAGRGIAVWALLGEPDWLTGDSEPDAALARIAAFNARRDGIARIAGLEFDIEPHADPRWADAALQPVIRDRWFAMLDRARRALPGMPLWVDVHPELIATAGLAERVDGATLMVYRNDVAAMVGIAREALTRWPKPLIVGMEIRSDAPAGETVGADWPTARQAIIAAFADHPTFAGTALHDVTGLSASPGTAP